MNKTKIEYLDYTWNPLAMRCTPISEGCQNCWHLVMTNRLTANPLLPREEQLAYADPSDPDKGPPVLREKELEAPHHRKKSARIGVQFMGDLFHESISSYLIQSTFLSMGEAEWHKYFILTKRPGRMFKELIILFDTDKYGMDIPACFWFGISAENQKTADERIPILLEIPEIKRWLSIEPMLSEIDIEPYLSEDPDINPSMRIPDWIVCGGETGPNARPLHPDWVRFLRDQCQAAGVPFFFKAWGEWAPCDHFHQIGYGLKLPWPVMQFGEGQYNIPGQGAMMTRCGHKRASRLLDGREWIETP
jgi:protein gp37